MLAWFLAQIPAQILDCILALSYHSLDPSSNPRSDPSLDPGSDPDFTLVSLS